MHVSEYKNLGSVEMTQMTGFIMITSLAITTGRVYLQLTSMSKEQEKLCFWKSERILGLFQHRVERPSGTIFHNQYLITRNSLKH